MKDERRKFKRFNVSLGVEFKTSEESDQYVVGITKNFSRSGLCIESQAFDHTPRAAMELKVKLPHQDKYVSILGEIAWSDSVDNRCWLGINLTEMDKEAKSLILDHAYNLWLDQQRKLQRTV